MKMKEINWNTMSQLGLIERINREILHPLGLAMSRNPSTGSSDSIFVADDFFWEYSDAIKNSVLSKDEIKAKLLAIQE